MVNDAVGQMAESLKNIERYLAINGTGGMGGGGGSGVSGGGSGVSGGAGSSFINPAAYVVKESDDLEGVDDGGTVTVQPGDTVPIVDARAANDQPLAVMAVGATDEPGVSYQLVVDDNRVVGGRMNSPFGLLNDPFSFIDKFGGSLPAENHVAYVATLDASAQSSVELAARLHINKYPGGQ